MLLKHQSYDCAIELQTRALQLFGPIYNISKIKLVALKEYIHENLFKNFN